ncbi:MAG: hypothetical protein LBQ01_09150, partial [Prevotellaceae bacterium]|nr:hypothetical protein [Prevotellaceae bacterium]
RLGSEHSSVHIFNFFPTTQADVHLGLEANITNKLQMFHYIMGEDAKYLSDGEIIGSQELFQTLNNKATYTGEEGGENSELKYLTMIREIRDANPALFEKVRKLPKQARSGMKSEKDSNQMITFFRLGNLKKFYLYEEQKSAEINFFDAMNKIECKPDERRQPVPDNYFDMLDFNRAQFRQDTTENSELPAKKGGKSNAGFIENMLKDPVFKNCKKFTESDWEFLNTVRLMLTGGVIAKKTAQLIKKELEKVALAENHLDPMRVLYILRTHIKPVEMEQKTGQAGNYLKREVILSEYFVK